MNPDEDGQFSTIFNALVLLVTGNLGATMHVIDSDGEDSQTAMSDVEVGTLWEVSPRLPQ